MRWLVAVAGLYCVAFIGAPSVFGQDWTLTGAPTNAWSAVACSVDGRTMYACAGGGTEFIRAPNSIYTSSDGGVSWAKTGAPSNSWGSIACSADGRKLVAAVGTLTLGGLYTSEDGGANWRSNDIPSKRW
jgi:hypothetical protein